VYKLHAEAIATEAAMLDHDDDDGSLISLHQAHTIHSLVTSYAIRPSDNDVCGS